MKSELMLTCCRHAFCEQLQVFTTSLLKIPTAGCFSKHISKASYQKVDQQDTNSWLFSTRILILNKNSAISLSYNCSLSQSTHQTPTGNAYFCSFRTWEGFSSSIQQELSWKANFLSLRIGTFPYSFISVQQLEKVMERYNLNLYIQYEQQLYYLDYETKQPQIQDILIFLHSFFLNFCI